MASRVCSALCVLGSLWLIIRLEIKVSLAALCAVVKGEISNSDVGWLRNETVNQDIILLLLSNDNRAES